MRPGHALEDGTFVGLGKSKLTVIERCRDLLVRAVVVVRIPISQWSVNGGGYAI